MNEHKSPFGKVRAIAPQQIDIEVLFKELRNRSPKIKNLFSHQADILRSYQQIHKESKDVGIELPTGSGKTLVGLLIGEWRKRTRTQRILYLCPTRQLAKQVGKQSKDYDIDTRVFIGPQSEYNNADLTLYRTAKIIAISTYSAFFNTNPKINDPQTIIFDDAHGAENYIGSMWSLLIERAKKPELYDAIFSLYESQLPPQFVSLIHQRSRPRTSFKSEKIPFGDYFKNLSALIDILGKMVATDDDLKYSWMIIQNGLYACHVYVSWDAILIRPYISPTLTHPPFLKAEQRIYMSATLGHGGELERTAGVREIKRIPVPDTYKSHGIGRRLFLFPDYTKTPNDSNSWTALKISETNRTLVLCPNQLTANDFSRVIDLSPTPLTILKAFDIEESMEPFTQNEKTLLLLTNRYDGLDLSDGVCKLTVVNGLPRGTNLQELFLENRLGLEILLRERIKTRIEQASGRCTRSDTDRETIIMLGRDILDFCARNENLELFHPELRAELSLILDPTNAQSDLDAMLNSYLANDENWKGAEENINELRSNQSTPDRTNSNILADVVKNEVDFVYAMWSSDFEKAIEYGRSVADKLTGERLDAYRALWYYFIANAAFVKSQEDPKYHSISSDFLGRAKAACRYISWFPYALRSMQLEKIPEDQSEFQAIAIENVANVIKDLGLVGQNFSEKIEVVERSLQSTDANTFDGGMVELGKYLGFTSWKPEGTAPPDAIWRLGNNFLFLFEGKSDENADSPVSVDNCRQTSGHLKWIKNVDDLDGIANKYAILVTPKSKIDKDALSFGVDVHYLNVTDMVKLFERTKSMLITSRSTMTNKSDAVGGTILHIMTQMKLTLDEILGLLASKKVTELSQI